MTARTLRFDFPLPVNLTNGRFHWRRLYREKVAFRLECDTRQQLGLLPPPPEKPFARAVAVVTIRLAREMDDDNAVARCKPIWDWLVTRGYLANDSRKCLQWQGFPRQVTKHDGNPHSVEVVLTELHASLDEVRQPVWPDVPSPFSETSEYP